MNSDTEKKTVFNLNNTGHKTKNYQMFFGECTGFADNINTVNKKIDDLRKMQAGFNWYSEEISLTQDRLDIMAAPKDVVELMKLTIAFQTATDSLASKSINAVFAPHCTNPEANYMLSWFAMIECLHAESYGRIVKEVFPIPDQLIDEIYSNKEIHNRTKMFVQVFDDVYNITQDMSLREKKKRMAKALCTLMAMEGVAFMASFAVTFGIAETGIFAGIAETVGLIARDENLHTLMSYELYKATKNVDGWADIYEEVKPEVQEIIDSIVEGELSWNKYLFSGGKSVVGLTENLLNNYVNFCAQTIYNLLGLKNPYPEVKTDPLTYMHKHLDRSSIQTANQELQSGSYRQGAVSDDMSDDLDLDFEF